MVWSRPSSSSYRARSDSTVVYRRYGDDPAYTTLRGWATDAQAAVDDWSNKTATQKDAVMRETIRRLGVFMDRMADQQLIRGQA